MQNFGLYIAFGLKCENESTMKGTIFRQRSTRQATTQRGNVEYLIGIALTGAIIAIFLTRVLGLDHYMNLVIQAAIKMNHY